MKFSLKSAVNFRNKLIAEKNLSQGILDWSLVVPETVLRWEFMKILIEDAETLQYLTTSGQWSKNASEGKTFSATAAAFEVARKEQIHKFNIVCYIPQTKQFINMDHGRGKGHVETPTELPEATH